MIAILVNGPANGREVVVRDNTRSLIVPVFPDWDRAKYDCFIRDEEGIALFRYVETKKANGESEGVQ